MTLPYVKFPPIREKPTVSIKKNSEMKDQKIMVFGKCEKKGTLVGIRVFEETIIFNSFKFPF
jgi:hypothetical protein